MGELKKLLEPVADGAGRDHDPYGALERRRARRARNKRLRAGALAIVIAAGGTLFAVRALGTGDAATPLEPGPNGAAYGGIWPESTLEQATNAQDRADAGDPAALWRLDAAAVAERFGTDVLGWQGASVAPDTVAYDGTATFSIAAVPVPCPTPVDGEPLPAACLPRTASLSLAQLIRSGDGGIWSVTAVGSDRLRIAGSALDSVEPGSRIPVTYDAPAGTTAFVGIARIDGSVSQTCQVTPLEGSGTFEVKIRDGACGGTMIVWAMIRPGTLDQIVGDGMPGDEIPSPFDGHHTVALAVASLHLTTSTAEPTVEPSIAAEPSPTEEPGGTAAPDVLRVTCSTDGTTTLGSDQVRVQDDGVHVRVEGQSDAFYAFLQGRDAGHFDIFSKGLSGPVTEFTYPYPPGPIYVTCVPVDRGPGGPLPEDRLRVNVLDPRGIWINDELACPSGDQVQAEGFRASAGALSVQEATPELAIRRHVPGVLDTDEVLIAEYGQETLLNRQVWMIVRRDGEVLAHFQVAGNAGRWGVHWGDTCKGSGVADSGSEPVVGATISS